MDSLDLFIRTYGYPALFGGMVLEQFVPPMPGEPLLLGAGALAGNGRLSLWLAAALALAGTVVGDLVWYEIGRIGGSGFSSGCAGGRSGRPLVAGQGRG